MTTTKIKLNWLRKNEQKYKTKMSNAFAEVRDELIDFVKNSEDTVLIRYLAQCTSTDDIQTFITIIKALITEANHCKQDLNAKMAKTIARVLLLKLHLLSGFTYQWTNIALKCKHCNKVSKHNFLYTNKLCPYCGHIML